MNYVMTDDERASYISHLVLKVIRIDKSKCHHIVFETSYLTGKMQQYVKSIAIRKNLFKIFHNIGNSGLQAAFSSSKLRESFSKSSDYNIFPYVIDNMRLIVENAKEIHARGDITGDENVLLVHQFVSIMQIENDIHVIQINVNELKHGNNVLYLITNKLKMKRDASDCSGRTLATIRLSEIVRYVNGQLLRLFPDCMLTQEQLAEKKSLKNKYESNNNHNYLCTF